MHETNLEELLAKQKRDEALRKEAENNAAKLAFERREMEDKLERGDQTVQLANILTKHLLSNHELESKKRKEAEKQAKTDSVTGLPNRRGFEAAMHKLKRSEDKGAILLLDADKFKNYNDTYGHLVGDRVLLEIAKFLKIHSRTDDIAARWAGDEFIVYFHGATAEEVMNKFQWTGELSAKTQQYDMNIPLTMELTENGQTKKIQLLISLSGGIVDYDPSREDFHSTFHKADRALYAAKEAGRGQLKIYEPHRPELKRPKRKTT